MILKRGQLTLFIIIGVIIIIGATLYVVVSNSDVGLFFGSKTKLSGLKDNIESCYTELARDSIDYVAYQGGYYDDFNGSYLLDSDGYILPFYYSEGEVLIPDLENIEKEIALFIDSNIYTCLENNEGFDLTYGKPDTEVKIKEEIIQFSTELSIKVNFENETLEFDLSDEPAAIDSKLKQMYEISKFYVESVSQTEEEWIPVTELAEQMGDDDLYIRVFDYVSEENEQKVVVYTDDTTTYPLMIRFVNKYNYNDLNLPIIYGEQANEEQ